MTEMHDPWDALEAPATREPRSLDKRGSSERKRSWVEPSLLPEPEPQDGWVFKWVRVSSRGTDDKLNVDKRFREGWEQVRAEDHPEILAAWHMPANKTGVIESGGLVLCKMPQEMVDQRNAEYLRRTQANASSAEEHYMRDQGELIKKFAENRRKRMFGPTAR